MKPFKMERTVTTKSIYRGTITGRDIIDILRSVGVAIPQTASVHFSIPGGGDWSNTDLEITAEHPIHLQWEITETSE